MAFLSLAKDDEGKLYLYSTASSRNADFSIFPLDGEGSGNPFDFGNKTWCEVEEMDLEIEYDEDDEDSYSFWQAQEAILEACVSAKIELPDYVIESMKYAY